MEPITVLLMLSFLLVIAGAVIAWMVIHQCKGRHEIQPAEDDDTQQEVKKLRPPTPAVENQLTIEQEKAPIAGETQLIGEKAQPTAAEEAEQIVPKETQATAVLEIEVTAPKEAESTAAQVAEQEETQPRAVVEKLKPIATETKQTLLEETRAITPEKSQPTLEEVQPRVVVEKPQLTGPKQGSPRAKEGRRKPIHRGGRPRVLIQPQERSTTRETTPRRPKPEIVCWKRARQWFIGVEVPEELLGNREDLVIYQNGLPLSPADSREACWLLNSISDQVTVRSNEGDVSQDVTLTFGQGGYLLFKLSGGNQGRLVRSASSGSYVVVAPETWERDETVAGPPPVKPESVAFDGYIAHFFDLEKGGETRIAFRTPEGDPITIPLSSARFELVGEQLEDAADHIGPLFGEPPKIRALDTQVWKDVKTIVIGEEGVGRKKWRTAFSPDSGRQEQEPPPEILLRRGGWYFLRFYDGNDDLMESLDFRFLLGLNEIKMAETSPLPSDDGHKPIRIQLVHNPDVTIHAVDDLPNIRIEREGSRTTLTVPPKLSYDITRWLVGYENGPQVEVTILVERLWWSLGEEDNEPSQWEDKPLALSRDDFTAISKKALWLRCLKCRWADKVLVGFERAKARPYSIKVAEKTLAVPLREFADAKEVMDHSQNQRLKVWIERGSEVMEGLVAVIPAIQVAPPLQEWVGIGRCKTAVARAMLQHGSGNITVNGSAIDQYFKKAPLKARRFLRRLRELPPISEVLSQLDAFVEVQGSSPDTMRQTKAVAHALARALMAYDPELTPLLRREGFGGVKVQSMSQRRWDQQ